MNESLEVAAPERLSRERSQRESGNKPVLISDALLQARGRRGRRDSSSEKESRPFGHFFGSSEKLKPTVSGFFGRRRRSPLDAPPRLLERDLHFSQSAGKFALKRKDGRFLWWEAKRPRNWFHLLLTLPTTKFMLVLMALYTLIVIIFAFIFLALNTNPAEACRLDHHHGDGRPFDFLAAFALSVITSATLGLGPVESEVAICGGLAFWIHLQLVVFAMIDATLAGLLFVRLSRGTLKESQIVFADQAVVRCVEGGSFTLTFQISELNFFTYHPVLRPHVSVYAVTRRPASEHIYPAYLPPPSGYLAPRNVAPREIPAGSAGAETAGGKQQQPDQQWQRTIVDLHSMAVTTPATEHDSVLILTVPQQLTHVIDAASPLHPPSRKQQATSVEEEEEGDNGRSSCAGGGSSSPVGSAKQADNNEDTAKVRARKVKALKAFRDDLAAYMKSEQFEILVAVDATDPLTGSQFQARHSYAPSDIAWDHAFAPCLVQSNETGQLKIDWDAFHALVPVPFGSGQNAGKAALGMSGTAATGASPSRRVVSMKSGWM